MAKQCSKLENVQQQVDLYFKINSVIIIFRNYVEQYADTTQLFIRIVNNVTVVIIYSFSMTLFYTQL
jgi:hypothetical protein